MRLARDQGLVPWAEVVALFFLEFGVVISVVASTPKWRAMEMSVSDLARNSKRVTSVEDWKCPLLPICLCATSFSCGGSVHGNHHFQIILR